MLVAPHKASLDARDQALAKPKETPPCTSVLSQWHRHGELNPWAKLSNEQYCSMLADVERLIEEGLPTGFNGSRRLYLSHIGARYGVSQYPPKKMYYRLTAGHYGDRMFHLFEPDVAAAAPKRMPWPEYLERRKRGALPFRYADGEDRLKQLRARRKLYQSTTWARLKARQMKSVSAPSTPADQQMALPLETAGCDLLAERQAVPR